MSKIKKTHRLTETAYLLACLVEECSEVIKEVQKGFRFGINNFNPTNGIVNIDAIQNEVDEDRKSVV